MKTMSRVATIAAVIALTAFLFATDEFPATRNEARKPWEWSLDERVAARFDVTAIRERYQRAAAENLVAGRSGAANVVVGRHNPELFFAFELFPYLTRAACDPDPAARQRNRDRLSAIIGETSDPAVFWTAFDDATRGFIANQLEEERLATQLRPDMTAAKRRALLDEIAAVQAPQCRLRQEAIAAMAAAVGRETLDRVLYTGIAPALTAVASEGELDPARVRFIAGGCR